MQNKDNPVNVISRYILDASDRDVYEYLNPKNFEAHDYAVYQFLTLNYIGGITAADVDVILKGEGILEGQGKTFLDACKKYNINIAYIIAHAILETGHGKSALANGIQVNEVGGVKVDSKTTYNMFGIGAWDENPLKLGSERAYKEGWFSVASAIEGGIKYISAGYINNNVCKQNTLYKMRWNPENPATHQYATDIGWAYKQSYRIKEILDKCKNAYLVFEIPQYK
jgi:beta-N-acetylglucosaminidase